MFRDRTNFFVSVRQGYSHHPYRGTVGTGIIGGGGFDTADAPLIEGDAIEMDNLPPEWLQIAGKLDHAVTETRREMGTLATLHKKNALPGFDDRSEQEREIERLTMHITKSLRKSQAIVKEFGELAHSEQNQEYRRMSENIKVALATKVQEASTMFRKMQSSYLKQLRKDTPLDSTSLLPALSMADTSSSAIDQDVALSEATLEQTQALLQEDTQDQQLRQREQEINKIAQGIIEVADIFKDLQTMVIDQGTLLDRIDYNIENMNTAVKDADRELVKGAKYQRSTQKCKIIFLLSLVVFGLLLVVILKPRR